MTGTSHSGPTIRSKLHGNLNRQEEFDIHACNDPPASRTMPRHMPLIGILKGNPFLILSSGEVKIRPHSFTTFT